jgi:hypothetical protein
MVSFIKSLVTLFVLMIGATVKLAGQWNAPLISEDKQGTESSPQLPLVIFSHGLAGQRTTYSLLCLELASKGFFVVAIEHADGTASVAELSGPEEKMKWQHSTYELPRHARGKWRWYGGLGDHVELGRPLYRLEEVRLAIKLMAKLNSGQSMNGLRISSCTRDKRPEAFVAGRIDMEKIIAVGHSYGGATAAWAASCVPGVIAGVSLDPWWAAMPEAAPVLNTWLNPTPLLVIGSEEWNVPLKEAPESEGTAPILPKMSCGYERREKVMETAGRTGGGCLRVCPKHSTHHSPSDILVIMEEKGVLSIGSCLSFPKPKVSPTEMHKRITSVMDIFIQDVISSDGKGALTRNCTDKYEAALSQEPDMIHELVLSTSIGTRNHPDVINISVDTC